MRLDDFGLWLFRKLLRLYPRAYRDRYAEEMEAFFLRERREEGSGIVFWMRQMADHLKAATAVRARDLEGWGMRAWFDEVRLALRGLRRAPGYTVFAVGTLALGVGATAAVFTVVDRVALRPMPYPASDRLVVIGSDFSHDAGGLGPLSAEQFDDLVESPGPAEAVVGVTDVSLTLTGLGDPERIRVNQVTAGFFEMLGAEAAAGRLLNDSDQAATAPRTALLDFGFWQERFGADAAVIGRTIGLEDQSYTVVGVLARHFVQPESVAGEGPIWIAARRAEGEWSKGAFGIRALARLGASAQLATLDDHVDAGFTRIHPFLLGGVVRSYHTHLVGGIAPRLGSALAGVALLLLIACANVASLTLTRTRVREREISVRAALGAGRGRLVRQLLTESGLVAVAGGVLGALAAFGAIEVFRTYAPEGIPRMAEIGVDGLGLAFAMAVSVFTLLFFGALPALTAAGRAGVGASRMGARATDGRRDATVRSGLVMLETALAVVLVVGSGLLANDLIRLSREDPGYSPGALISMQLNLTGRVASRDATIPFWTELLSAAESLPGVTAAALTTQIPYSGSAVMQSITPEGLEDDGGTFITTVSVAGNPFSVLGIALREGRTFEATEDGGRAGSVVVNEAFVREYWPDGGPIGRQILFGDAMDEGPPTYAVIGVVADVRSRAGLTPTPQVYLPLQAEPRTSMELIARASGQASALGPDLRNIVRSLDPGLPVTRIRTVESVASAALARPRFYTGLFGSFATAALLLALVGVYGTTAFSARSRRREIGIRLALGAAQPALVRRVVLDTSRVLAIGVVVGLVVSALASGTLSGLLLYVTPRDGFTYVGVAALVMAAGVVATWIPASHASRVDPVSTLRED